MSLHVSPEIAPTPEYVGSRLVPPVFVMNLYYSGIGIARNLAGRGVDVYGLSSEPQAPGMRSRFFKQVYEVPNGRDFPDALCERLIQLRQGHEERPVIFPTRDLDIVFLSRYRHQLSPYYRLPGDTSIDYLLDKLTMANIARDHNILVPATFACTSVRELGEIASQLRFPVVIKPRFAYQWREKGAWEAVGARKAFLVHSEDELKSEFNRVAVSQGVLVQEFIAGSDTDIVVCCCYMSQDHKLLAQFTAKKLRQNPPLFGTGCAIEAAEIPEIAGFAERLLQACGYTGLAEVEFKHDRSTGSFYLIEVNPRHWDQHELGTLMGVNLTWAAYQEMTGQPSQPQYPVYHSAVRYRWIAETEAFTLILRNLYYKLWVQDGSDRSTRGSFSRYWRSLADALREALFLSRGHKIYAIFDRRDPLPGILLCSRTIREFLSLMRRMVMAGFRTRQATPN